MLLLLNGYLRIRRLTRNKQRNPNQAKGKSKDEKTEVVQERLLVPAPGQRESLQCPVSKAVLGKQGILVSSNRICQISLHFKSEKCIEENRLSICRRDKNKNNKFIENGNNFRAPLVWAMEGTYVAEWK